jgi:predicted 3-demethylubiquinone-9 3-methyltransferase (glyoxalase superfamily)
MKMTLESTTKIVKINGVDCRVWEGKTERGAPMHAYIAMVAVDRNEDTEEFERDLQEHRPPSPAIGWIPDRMVRS